MDKVNQDILWFRDIDKNDIPLVGGKGANLGEMVRAGLPVPEGFVVTAKAYLDFLKTTRLDKTIYKLLKNLDPNNSKKLNEISKKIRTSILKSKVPTKLKKEIDENYHHLYVNGVKVLFVAVRSSATAEDLPDASFAGQQESFLNISGSDEVIAAVLKCWASLFHARAIYYRIINKFDHSKVGIAVPVMRMVQSEASGVMFSIDPVANDDTKVTIEAGFGLGEAVVLGVITPDRYLVDKKTFKILDKEINQQDWKISKVGISDRHVTLPKLDQKKQKISDEDIVKLAKLAVSIESHYGRPQDMEWALEGGKIYMIQSRPVTTFKPSQSGSLAKENQPDSEQSQSVEVKSVSKVDAKILVTGAAASMGMVSGPVMIIHSPSEIDKVKKGDILVTEKTNPDFVPAMQKAAAIVTDTGGRTCFAGQTKVLTNLGFVEIKEISELIKKGKKLLIPSLNKQTLKIEWKKIIASMESESETIKINVSQTGRSKISGLEVTANHRFLTLENRKLVENTIADLINKDVSVLSITSLPGIGKNKANIDLAYLIGVLGTDGSIYQTRTHGEIQFIQKNTPEKESFIIHVRELFEKVYGYSMRPCIKKASASMIRGRIISGEAMAYRCYSKELTNNYAEHEQNIGLAVLENEPEFSQYFMAGALDGDGSFNQKNYRLNFYGAEKHIFEPFIMASLRNGILPQVCNNREALNIQLTEDFSNILAKSKRIKGSHSRTKFGSRFFSAKQILGDVIDRLNYKGRIRPYINKNLLLDAEKIRRDLLPIADAETKKELNHLLASDLRMLRVNFVENGNKTKVYNLTVQDNHNYIVFTDNYTPVIVANSHAAIVSREMGIPCVVGTGTATSALRTGQIITVDGVNGKVYQGKIEPEKAEIDARSATGIKPIGSAVYQMEVPVTATKVYVNLAEPEKAQEAALLPADGVGLLRAEFIIAAGGKHPRWLVENGKSKEYVDILYQGISKIVSAFSPRPVIYRATDFKTNEYRGLEGGDKYEPKEENPMIGYRGCFRYIKEPDLFKLELEAIKKIRDGGMTNLWLMIPFVRTVKEFQEVTKLIEDFGLKRSNDFKIYIMCEVPSTVLLMEEFCKMGIDGVSIGSNDLTQLILGVDRDNEHLAEEFDERNPAVAGAIAHVIKVCRKYNVSVSICGQAPSIYPEITELMVKNGATSVSVVPDMVIPTRKTIASVEKKILLNEATE
ncbi:MAG: PEP/pyruvate-binding domain-containing protein [Patescibacteria group bacterium]